MNTREKANGDADDKQWRRLCELVSAESNPERLSQLIDQLLRELDARRRTLRDSDKQ
jgi:hypothetical protein